MSKLDKAKALYVHAREAYYNHTPIMSDAEFDRLEDHIRSMDPSWAKLRQTGTPVRNKKTEVVLAEPMPSLNKAYSEDLAKWLAKNPSDDYVIMDKLDGSSVQLTYTGGKPVKLVTRGDGVNGGDISFLIPHLNLPTISNKIPFLKGNSGTTFHLRCEALMTKKNFKAKWSKKFDNGRNMVNGLLNRRDPHPALADIDFVVLGVYYQELTVLKKLESLGFKVVPTVSGKIRSTPQLEQHLKLRRAKGEYDMDGLVIAPTDFVLSYQTNDKPKNIIAFKVNDESNAAEVTVKRIIWQVTGRSRIVPKIEIEPTHMDGVMVKHAAAHNAEWMMDRNIGPGAIVKVLRSGGVIPKIVSVVKKGKFQPPEIDYEKKGVHFVVSNADSATSRRVDVLNVCKFMKTLGVELIAGKTADQLFKAGFRTPLDYIKAWGEKRLGLALHDAGIGGKQGLNVYNELDRVFSNPISLRSFMVASQCFGVGIGDRKLSAIEAAKISMYELLNVAELSNLLSPVDGFSEKTIRVISDGMPELRKFYCASIKHLTIEGGLPRKKAVATGVMTGQKVSFTGYRDKDHELILISKGAEIVPFGSKTTILLYKEGGKSSSKLDKAAEKGVRVCTFQDLSGPNK
jgi:NAD-dependent DNA ligase